MEDYEELSPTCKIRWIENFKITNQRHSQVSGYIFNDKNEMLIVKSNNTWTIPGGHPEDNESFIETLNREVIEEACITLKDISYLGAVEVVEENQIYYQLRYFAKVKEIFPFKNEWETSERLFIEVDNLSNYIKWSKGLTFSKQILSALKILKKN